MLVFINYTIRSSMLVFINYTMRSSMLVFINYTIRSSMLVFINYTIRSSMLVFLGLKNTECLTKLLPDLSTAYNETFLTYMSLNSSMLIDNTTTCDLKLKVPSEEYWE